MNTALMKLLDQHGDVSFPHAPATAEELLLLFRAGNASPGAVVDHLVELAYADPGFAFNLARLFREEEMPLASMPRIALRPAIERFNAFRIVSILGPKETWTEVFGTRRRLACAYADTAALAVKTSNRVFESTPGVEGERDLALLMTFESALGLLGLANLVPEKALPVLEAGLEAERVCESSLGFPLAAFSRALNERYALPDAGNTAYPAAIREAVRTSWEEAKSINAAAGRTRIGTTV
jgi:hypothetical protein